MSSHSYEQINPFSTPQKIIGHKSHSFGSTNQHVFYQLHKNIYISNFETCHKLHKNIRILDVRSTINNTHIRSTLNHNSYKSVNMSHVGRYTDLYNCLPLCFDFITTNQDSRPIIICCETGTNQSVVVGLAYLVIVCQNNLQLSIKHLKKNSAIDYKSSMSHNNEIEQINHSEFLNSTALEKMHLSLDSTVYHPPNPDPEYLGQLFHLEMNFLGKNSYHDMTSLFSDIYGPDAVMVNTSKFW